MTAITKASDFAKGIMPTPVGDCAGDLIITRPFIDVTAAQLTLNAMFDVGILPAGHVVTDMVLVPDDLDTGTATVALDVGILSGTPGDTTSDRTIGSEYFAADTGARTGAISRMSAPGGFKVAPTDTDRSIGVKVQAAPNVAAAGRIRLVVTMAPASYADTF